MAAKIRKGDKVVVLAGRDKGRTGEVIEVRPDAGRALVRGVNMVKRHQKQTAQQEGGIISKEATDPPVQPGAGRSQGRQADPRRLQVRRRRRRPPQGARRQAFRSRDRWLTSRSQGGKPDKQPKARQVA